LTISMQGTGHSTLDKFENTAITGQFGVQPRSQGEIVPWKRGSSDLCFRETREGKSHDHRDVIVYEMLCF